MTEQKVETYKEKQERLKTEREVLLQEKRKMAVDKMTSFKADLAELLKKHNAILGMSISGDTYGIYDENNSMITMYHGALGDFWTEPISADKILIRYSDLVDQK